MFKKFYIQFLGVFLLLFFSGNVVFSSVESYSKIKKEWAESDENETDTSFEDAEEDLDEDYFLNISFFDFQSDLLSNFLFCEKIKFLKKEKKYFDVITKLEFELHTPIYIQNNQIKISC